MTSQADRFRIWLAEEMPGWCQRIRPLGRLQARWLCLNPCNMGHPLDEIDRCDRCGYVRPDCRDDDGNPYFDHDWSEWIDRPVDMEPARKPDHPVRLRYCFRCNKYEGKRLGEIEQIGAKGD